MGFRSSELGGQFDGSVGSTKNQEHLSAGRLSSASIYATAHHLAAV